MRYNEIGTVGVAIICQFLSKNPALDKLVLHYNEVDGEGAFLFANVLKTNSKLRKLDLLETEINGAGSDSIYKALSIGRSYCSQWAHTNGKGGRQFHWKQPSSTEAIAGVVKSCPHSHSIPWTTTLERKEHEPL